MPSVVCTNPAPKFKVPPVPFLVIPVEFTFPLNVTVPDVLVLVNLPVVVNPPIDCAVPDTDMPVDPKFTLALVLLLMKLPVPKVTVPAPVLVIVPVTELVMLPEV